MKSTHVSNSTNCQILVMAGSQERKPPLSRVLNKEVGKGFLEYVLEVVKRTIDKAERKVDKRDGGGAEVRGDQAPES